MTMTTATCKAWMGPALFVSVALNVFALGYLSGQPMHHGFSHKEGNYNNAGGGVLRHQLDKLNDADREKAQAIMDKYKPQLKAEGKQSHDLREQVADALKSPNYSRKDTEALFAQLRDSSGKSQQQAQTMMLDIADALPADERAIFFSRPSKEERESDKADHGAPAADNNAADTGKGERHKGKRHHKADAADDADSTPAE